MAKYGIGDKVRVRDDLKYGEWYYMHTSDESQMANGDMVEKVGQIVTIKDYDSSGCYYIEEDQWHWTDEMFSESNEATKKYPVSNLKVGDKVRVREDLKLDVDYCMCDGTLGVEINREMKNKGGAIVTIKEFDKNGRYYIEEDQWHWVDEMFSELVKSDDTITQTKRHKVSDLKIGDRVIVRPDLDIDKKYADANGCYRIGVNSSMCRLKGTVVTIKTVNDHDYNIKEDDEEWYWTDEMFSEKVEEITRKFKVGDVVRFRNDLFAGMSMVSEEGKSLGILSSMSDYAGQEATITDITGPTYTVDTNRFCWYAGAFEDKTIDKSISDEEKEIKTKPPFEVGDKVLVREDLEKGKFYNNVSTSDYDAVTEFMLDLCGRVCTIEKKVCDKYKLVEDARNYSWTEEMFMLDEYPSEKAKEQSKEEEKEDKPSLLEYQVEHQHDIPKRLFYLAEKYPNITWKKAKEYYARVVDNVILGAGEESLFSGSLSFGKGLKEAAARFEELLKLEEKAVSLKSTVGTIATFEGVPVFEDKTPKLVSDSDRTSKKIDCFSCTSADCANCENFKYKMAIT